jgi:hypothetical protein
MRKRNTDYLSELTVRPTFVLRLAFRPGPRASAVPTLAGFLACIMACTQNLLTFLAAIVFSTVSIVSVKSYSSEWEKGDQLASLSRDRTTRPMSRPLFLKPLGIEVFCGSLHGDLDSREVPSPVH